MSAARHEVIRTSMPAPVTLAQMGRTAKAASDTWTFRKWAARLATKAPPRDYRGQLRHLYRGVLDRWRYVAEPEEWIHGTPRSLIAHVLGVEYNSLPSTDPTRVDLERVPATQKGWGDCDDVATVVAAGVRALGMTPYFRVSRRGASGHVAVLARTPRGELVSVDPVGHPEHGFGWAQAAPHVEIWGLDGQPVTALQLGQGGPTMYSQTTARTMLGADNRSHETLLGALEPRAGLQFRAAANAPHYCRTMMGDVDGPRVLAVPMRHLRLLKRGIVSDGLPAVDEHGRQYFYHAGHDMWIDGRLARTPLGQLPENMGGFLSFFRRIGRRIKKGFKRVFRGIRNVVKRVVKAVRWVGAKILGSKFVQKIVGGILQMYGVPSRLTQGVLAAAAQFIKQGGIWGFIKTLRKNPKMALALAARAARAGLQRAGIMSGPEDAGTAFVELSQNGRVVPAQPVLGIVGVPGVDELGALAESASPEPGRWYRPKYGDDLLAIAGRAYGLKAGNPERLKRAKWINNAVANAPYRNPNNVDRLFPEGKVELKPKWSCDTTDQPRGARGTCYPLLWIPIAQGDEPVEELPPPSSTAPEAPPEILPTAEPMPPTQAEPPMPPIVHEPIDVPSDVPSEPEPSPTELPPSKGPDPLLAERMESCQAAGGQWVEPPPGEGEPFCDMAPPMPPESPLEPIPTAPTPTALPPPGLSEAERCAASGGVWAGGYCHTPGMCRAGTIFDPDTGECVRAGPAPGPSPLEPIPTEPLPPSTMPPQPGGAPWVGLLPLLFMVMDR